MQGSRLSLASLESVDCQWLTEALGARYPGVRVTGMRRLRVIRGMATKAQFALDYNAAGRSQGLPSSMWLKCGFEAHSARSVPLYAAEVNFYRDLAPLLTQNCPKSYFEAIEPITGNGILLLEDLTLRGARFGNPAEAVDVETARSVLSRLAGFHGLFRSGSFARDDFPWLAGRGAVDTVDVIDEYFGFWETAASQPRFKLVDERLRDRDRMKRAVRRSRELIAAGSRDWFVHGDCHPGNMFFPADGTVGLLDWQTATLGEWATDVAYFLVLALRVEDRRRHERELLLHYLAALDAAGAKPPAFDDAWRVYRQHAMWCFLTILCPVDRQPEETCKTWAQRASAAIVDLETVDSLGS